MLAARRFRFSLLLVAFLPLAFSLSGPLCAQVPSMEFHGVPSSGIGGANAVFSALQTRPNAAGNGGTAIGCCASFFFPSSFSPLVPYPSVVTGHREHRRRHRRSGAVVGVAEPFYIPYAVANADDSDDAADDQNDNLRLDSPVETRTPGELSGAGGRNAGRRQFVAGGIPEDPGQQSGGDAAGDSESGAGGDATPEAAPIAPEEPVVAQPTTVLVFKDGHRLEVVNYAIVGDTLFDFSADRTHKILIADLDIQATQKANDASGVEFKLPPAGEAAGAQKSGAN
jgi:hypothetical protein